MKYFSSFGKFKPHHFPLALHGVAPQAQARSLHLEVYGSRILTLLPASNTAQLIQTQPMNFPSTLHWQDRGLAKVDDLIDATFCVWPISNTVKGTIFLSNFITVPSFSTSYQFSKLRTVHYCRFWDLKANEIRSVAPERSVRLLPAARPMGCPLHRIQKGTSHFPATASSAKIGLFAFNLIPFLKEKSHDRDYTNWR